MVYDKSNVPTDVEQLQELVISLSQANAGLHTKLDKMTKELQRLTLLFEKFFNKSSQKLLQSQEEREAEKQAKANEPVSEPPKGKRGQKGGGGRNPLPPGLPRVEQRIDVPEEERTCAECDTPFKCIGEERSETLHFKPMELFVVVTILLKYIANCACSSKRSTKAESPIQVDDKGVASNSLIAAIAVQKYMDHLPIARQSKQLFRRAGVHLPESSMCRWMGLAATICASLYQLMQQRLLEAVYVQMDATNVKFLDPDTKGKANLGTIWGYCGDVSAPYVLYDFQINGTRAGPAAFLEGYTGFVQCDASTVNRGLFVSEEGTLPLVSATEVGCWAHCRSNFFDARKYQPASMEMLQMIRVLYSVERRAKKLSAAERLSLRQSESLPMLDRIFDWCRENASTYDLPTDMLGKAIRYALNQESFLRIYCSDSRLEIDNNAAERILRLIAIGRKNWQFYGSANGGRTGAVLHSLLASAHRHGLNEYEYFLDVLDVLSDLPSHSALCGLLPDRWKPKASR
jgi:transposase/regulator of replication initiation timing